MLKKMIGFILSCTLLVTLSSAAFAAEVPLPGGEVVKQEISVLENGDTITTTLRVTPIYTRGVAETVSADKTIEYKTVDGVAWDFTISGDFTYNGSTARASNPSNDYNTYLSGWSCTKHTASASGASIKGSAAFKHTNGTSRTANPTLTCSPNGDFS